MAIAPMVCQVSRPAIDVAARSVPVRASRLPPSTCRGHRTRQRNVATAQRFGFLDRSATRGLRVVRKGDRHGGNQISSRRTSVAVKSFLSPEAFFNLATIGVMPLYVMMIGFPRAQLTKQVIASPLPDLLLSAMYIYLLCQSWEPDTARLIMNPDYYYLPSLESITLLFSRIVTVASAWIHLLAVDLFAAKQVYLDSMEHTVPSAHSLVLCMMCCPVGILSHAVTKAIVLARRKNSGFQLA